MDPYDELRKLEQEIEAAIAEIDAILGRKPGMITIPPMAVVNYGDGETFPAFTVIADYREERTIIHKGPCPKRVYRPHDSWNTLDCEATLEDAHACAEMTGLPTVFCDYCEPDAEREHCFKVAAGHLLAAGWRDTEEEILAWCRAKATDNARRPRRERDFSG